MQYAIEQDTLKALALECGAILKNKNEETEYLDTMYLDYVGYARRVETQVFEFMLPLLQALQDLGALDVIQGRVEE